MNTLKKRTSDATKMQRSRLHSQNAVMNKFRLGGVDQGITYTITELIEALPDINHRTVRRSVHDLVDLGHLYEVGRRGNAILYGTDVAVRMSGKSNTIMYVLGGELVDLPTFVMKIMNRQDSPFSFGHTSNPIIREGLDDSIRKTVAVGILSSDSDQKIQSMFAAKAALQKIKEELGDLYRLISALEDSSIFKPHQRALLYEDMKELSKKHPNLMAALRDVAS